MSILYLTFRNHFDADGRKASEYLIIHGVKHPIFNFLMSKSGIDTRVIN